MPGLKSFKDSEVVPKSLMATTLPYFKTKWRHSENEQDAQLIREFIEVQLAVDQIKHGLQTVGKYAQTTQKLKSWRKDGTEVQKSIARSSASIIACKTKSSDFYQEFLQMANQYQFDPSTSGVHEKILYPVVTDLSMEQLAFTHRSWININQTLSDEQRTLLSNERLEFLGDSWLGALVAFALYQKYPTAYEGTLTRLKTEIVSNKNLEKICLNLGFEKKLQKNIPIPILNRLDKSNKCYADCFEAYIGALIVTRFKIEFKEILDWIEDLSESILKHHESSATSKSVNRFAKQELNSYLVGNTLDAKVEYRKTALGPPFVVQAILGDGILGTGTGLSSKEAEKRAAADALNKPNLLQNYSRFAIEGIDRHLLAHSMGTKKVENSVYSQHTGIKLSITPKLFKTDTNVDKLGKSKQNVYGDKRCSTSKVDRIEQQSQVANLRNSSVVDLKLRGTENLDRLHACGATKFEDFLVERLHKYKANKINSENISSRDFQQLF